MVADPNSDEASGKTSEEASEGKPLSGTAIKLLRRLRKSAKLERSGEVSHDAEVLPLLVKVGARAVPVLQEAMADPRWEVRWAAAYGLEQLGRAGHDKEMAGAIPPLVKALKAEERQVRAKVIEALGACKAQRREALPALVKALGDKDAELGRLAVMQVVELGQRTPKATAQLMLQVIEKRKQTLARIGALLVLFHLGPAAKAAASALVPLLEDPSAEIREYAHLALMGIRTPSMRLEIIRTASMRLKVADESDEEPKPRPAKKSGGKKKPAPAPAPASESEDEGEEDEGDLDELSELESESELEAELDAEEGKPRVPRRRRRLGRRRR